MNAMDLHIESVQLSELGMQPSAHLCHELVP